MALNETRDDGQPGTPYLPGGKVEKHPVAEPSGAWLAMAEAWQLIDTLLGGTRAMRAAGHIYLPKHEYEETEGYKRRLKKAVLDNYTADTLDQLVGKAFNTPPEPDEDVQGEVLTFLEDVDGEGQALAPFARAWFRAGIRHGLAYALVDYTAPNALEVDDKPRTLADDAKAGVRPVWRLIEAPRVLGFTGLMIGGVFKPTMVRFRDDVLEATDYGEELKERIKVLRIGSYELWELQTTTGKRKEWTLVGAGPMDIDEIPIVPFYTQRLGIGEAGQPLENLGWLNVEHWQSKSDQQNVLTVARFPILAASGVSESEGEGTGTVVIGPNKFLTTPDPQSKIYYVEHGGTSISAGVTDLERLEERMKGYAAQFLQKQPGGETATGRALDSAEALSPLKGWGIDFKDCLERALALTGKWMGMGDDGAGSIIFEVDDEVDLAKPEELQWLTAARAKGDISREASLQEAKRRGILPPDFDIEADKERIESEAPPPGTGLDGLFPGGNNPGQQPGLPPQGAPPVQPKKPGAEKPAPKE